MEDHDHDHDRGLAFDLATLLDRRRALQLLGGAGVAALLTACGSKAGSNASATSSGEQ